MYFLYFVYELHCLSRPFIELFPIMYYTYVLYTRVNNGRDRLTCIAKRRMFTRSFFFPDTAAEDGMTSCTYVIFVLARLPAGVYNTNSYKYNIWICEIWINFLGVLYVFIYITKQVLMLSIIHCMHIILESIFNIVLFAFENQISTSMSLPFEIQKNYSSHFPSSRLVFKNYYTIFIIIKIKLFNINLNINLFYIINNRLLFN